MGREAKGQKELPRAAAQLPPPPGAAPDLSAGWPLKQRPERAAEDVPLPATRWFDAGDAEQAAEAAPPPKRLWAAPLLVAALVAIAAAPGVASKGVLAGLVAVAAVAVFLRGRRGRPAAPPAPVPRRGLSLDGTRLWLRGRGTGSSHALLATDEPFGVTLLASPRRDRALALLSSSAGAAYVGATFDATTRRAFASLLDRASTVSADEVGLEAIGPDGEPIVVAPATLAALVDELGRRAPGCLDRFRLTDARGTPLCLEGRVLRAGGREFDLSALLEWRAFVFQETLGQAVALYQGTWIRQGSNEVVLVCLLPAMTPAPEGEGVALSTLDRGALRDLRLMQGAPATPPPADQRVAIDRMLMVPIRSALDKAPRPAAQPLLARA